MRYSQVFSPKPKKTVIPQMQPLPGEQQVKNNAGGFVYSLDDWKRLDRFLILGTEGGTFYVTEPKQTKLEGKHVIALIKEDGVRVVNKIVEISDAGRAVKNDPAIFALALAVKYGNEATKRAAYLALPKVCRIGTHLFHFMQFVKDLDGPVGKGFQRAIQRWYTERKVDNLTYQCIKYQQRDGWSHRDVLRLARPKAMDGDMQALFQYVVKGRQKKELGPVEPVPENLRLIWAFERLKDLGDDPRTAAKIIADFRVPHEAVPNELKDKPVIWEALLTSMKPEAILRNLNKMTAIGLITNLSQAAKYIESIFEDGEQLKRARLHPMKILIGMKTYSLGHGFKGHLTWQPVRRMVDMLDRAFYLAFGAVTPTGKDMMLALDVSGSMTMAMIGSIISCREASAAMALVTANVEKNYEIVGFTNGSYQSRWSSAGYGSGITPLKITPRMRLDEVCKYIDKLSFGGTDCALPMIYAAGKSMHIDSFMILTDNETWAGSIHPSEALRQYRQKMNVPARLAVVGMTATGFTIADPKDEGMLDVVGFDAGAPEAMSEFFRGGC
jgi:60 kDa SS-A/Ro ribonucleoprotein